MSQTLSLSNFESPNIRETSKLNDDAAVGSTTLTVSFSDDIEQDDFLYLSRLGTESGEVVVVSSITDADTLIVNSPGTTKPHSRFDDVTVLFGDEIKIYRASNVDGTRPDDSGFSFLDTVSIDYDQLQTSYIDADGSSDYWYKYIYRNSSSGEETQLADSAAARGGGVGIYASVDAIRKEAGFQGNRYILDSLIATKRAAAQALIDSELTGIYVVPFTAPINPLITDITTKLAAGYLLTAEYSSTAPRLVEAGEKKIKSALDQLALINSRELVLTGVTGVEIESSESVGFRAWPDDTTGTNLSDPTNGAPRMFTTQDRY